MSESAVTYYFITYLSYYICLVVGKEPIKQNKGTPLCFCVCVRNVNVNESKSANNKPKCKHRHFRSVTTGAQCQILILKTVENFLKIC